MVKISGGVRNDNFQLDRTDVTKHRKITKQQPVNHRFPGSMN